MIDDDDLILQARKAFDRAKEYWADNFDQAKDDLRFARLGEQWPVDGPGSKRQREMDGRPCETFNKLPSFIRQVVNDSRQNKPAIKVHPQDSGADPEVAEIINGLIRNIEVTSDADVAYDTAIEHAVGQGFGYWRINTRYSCDDTFDQDIVIERVANPFTVFGDPNSTAADSSDWNEAFIVTMMTQDEFEDEYPDAEKTDWESDLRDCDGWRDGENIVVAEWWVREKVKGSILALSDGSIVSADDYKGRAEEYRLYGIKPVGEPRVTETHKVTQRIMSGAEILKTVSWAGKFIPIVPVYGDEISDEQGKRHFHSLIRPAKGAQRMYNYMRNTGIEILALQPKAPFIGPAGTFDVDKNWDNVNDQSLAFLEYDPSKGPAPQRQPPPQGSQAVLQESLNANDDMKAIVGIYDASLGARSNETSGRAIMARQREGDVSTFHFIDNLQRAIRHGGRILLDLIPKVYSTERVIRVLGEDMQPRTAQIAPTGQPMTPQTDEAGEPQQGPDGALMHIYDITSGKYDLTVSSGPSYTSRREEVQQVMAEMMQAAPAIAPILIPRIVKMLDIPEAEEIAAECEVLNPANQMQQQAEQAMGQMQQQAGEQMQQLQQQAGQMQQQAQQQIQALEQQLASMQAALKDKGAEMQIRAQELEIKSFEAQTARLKAATDAQKPTHAPSMSQAT